MTQKRPGERWRSHLLFSIGEVWRFSNNTATRQPSCQVSLHNPSFTLFIFAFLTVLTFSLRLETRFFSRNTPSLLFLGILLTVVFVGENMVSPPSPSICLQLLLRPSSSDLHDQRSPGILSSVPLFESPSSHLVNIYGKRLPSRGVHLSLGCNPVFVFVRTSDCSR